MFMSFNTQKHHGVNALIIQQPTLAGAGPGNAVSPA